MEQSVAFRKASMGASTNAIVDDCEIPRLTRTPWEAERYKRNSIWKRAPQEVQLSHEVFKNLPREVYDCVLEQLELLLLNNHQYCPSCYLRDLCNISLTSRAWDRAATLQMYRKAWILSHDESCKLPKLRVGGTSRLMLLRRTLRERIALAKLVREIHMPDIQALYLCATIEREEIVNLVASLVMACPNLERLVGFHIPYTHSFDRLSHALSTRPRLKERLWLMSHSHVEDDEDGEESTRGFYHAACDPTEKFLELNFNQQYMSTFVLHQESAQPAIDLTYRAVIGTLRQLPLLCHLSLSGLSSSSFSNLALNALPSGLQSLRLENLPGINDRGLQRLSSSHVVTSLKSLSLIDLEINRLDVIAGFLSPHLHLLERFTLCQDRAPTQHAVPDLPTLQSDTLQNIHWELRSDVSPKATVLPTWAPGSSSTFPLLNDEPLPCLATTVLATSIKDGLLPALRRLRAPHDPQGLLQALCKSLSTALLPSDASFSATNTQSEDATAPSGASNIDRDATCSLKDFLSTSPDDRADSVVVSPSSTSVSSLTKHNPYTTPPIPVRSRLAAQARILAARATPDTVLRVTDPEDNVRLETNIGGFLGNLSSNIEYDLMPDRDHGMVDDENECMHDWITGVDDVTGEWLVDKPKSECRHARSRATGRRAVEIRDLF